MSATQTPVPIRPDYSAHAKNAAHSASHAASSHWFLLKHSHTPMASTRHSGMESQVSGHCDGSRPQWADAFSQDGTQYSSAAQRQYSSAVVWQAISLHPLATRHSHTAIASLSQKSAAHASAHLLASVLHADAADSHAAPQ